MHRIITSLSIIAALVCGAPSAGRAQVTRLLQFSSPFTLARFEINKLTHRIVCEICIRENNPGASPQFIAEFTATVTNSAPEPIRATLRTRIANAAGQTIRGSGGIVHEAVEPSEIPAGGSAVAKVAVRLRDNDILDALDINLPKLTLSVLLGARVQIVLGYLASRTSVFIAQDGATVTVPHIVRLRIEPQEVRVEPFASLRFTPFLEIDTGDVFRIPTPIWSISDESLAAISNDLNSGNGVLFNFGAAGVVCPFQ